MTGKPPSILVLGAFSDMAGAFIAAARAAGLPLVLAARQPATVTGHGDPVHRLDVTDLAGHARFLDGLPYLPDIAICFVGALGDQARAETDFREAERIVAANFTGPACLLEAIAARMAKRGGGAIVGVSSVAGDRGRASNTWYGAAKAGFTAFLSGLRQRMDPAGVRVVTVKPGRIRTRMTAGLALTGIAARLLPPPERIAPGLLRACLKSRGTVYLPWYWRPVMALVRAVPEPAFRRLGPRQGR